MDHKIIRKYIRCYGLVQGVGFRYRARYAADAVGATGWVRNEYDGSVAMEVQGTEAQIDRVVRAVERSSHVDIEDMEMKSIPVKTDERRFKTKY